MKNKYFEGKSGVYHNTYRDEIMLIHEREPIEIYDKKKKTFHTVKRYDVVYKKLCVNNVAVVATNSLNYLGEL